MPRSDAFDDYYRESRERLLLQVYAFAADPETARGALDDAYVAAAEHWTDLAVGPDRDAWMRKRAFEAAVRWRESRQPWYRRSRNVADEHQRLLTALAGLRPIDRHLVVARYLAGVSLPAAAREVELPVGAASDSLNAATSQLSAAGIDTSPPDVLVRQLAGLGSDLRAYTDEDPAQLKAHALRRRRTRQGLTAAVVIALAVGIGGITAAQEPDSAPRSDDSTGGRVAASTSASQPTTSPPPPAPPPPPTLDAGVLTPASSIRSVDRGRAWTVLPDTKAPSLTTADPCLARPSGRAKSDSYEERQFTAGRTPRAATLTQTVAASPTPREARTAYRSLVMRLTTCSPGPTRITAMASLHGAGDEAVSVTTRHVDRRGIYERRVVAARTGSVVATWAGRWRAGSQTISSQVLSRLLGSAINAMCERSDGTCSARPYQQRSQTPPAEPDARGFLSPVDLPVFDGLTKRWTATQVQRTGANRASTQCDQAFVDSGATSTRSRTYVITGGGALPAIFGITETVGRFPTAKATTTFMRDVVSAVESCSDAPETVATDGVNTVKVDPGTAYRWDVSVQTSPNTTVVYRSGLVRVGRSVAQVTFTPGGDYDPKAGGHVALMRRAAERLTQIRP